MKIFLNICFVLGLLLYQPLYSQTSDSKLEYSEIIITSDIRQNLATENGEGLYFDVIRAIYEPIGIKVKIMMLPYASGISAVKNNKADAWVGSLLKEQKFALYPNWYLYRNKQVVLSYINSGNVYENIDSLRDKNLISMKGYNWNKYVSQSLKYNVIESFASAFSILRFGRADFFIGNESDIVNGFSVNVINSEKYKMDLLTYSNIYMAFGKTARGKYFMDLWDKQITQLKNDKSFLGIYEKYGYMNPFEN